MEPHSRSHLRSKIIEITFNLLSKLKKEMLAAWRCLMLDCLGPQTELQLLQTALIETKCQILQTLAGAMDKPASKQLEVQIVNMT